MKNIVFSGILMFVLTSLATGQGKAKMSRDEYIITYRDAAIEEMLRSGVPASITLAQGMLESDNGNSTLAVKGNNHFGIKCHSTWKGKKIHHDDDEKNECFRQYKSARESYADHSDFLMGSSRYAFLFNIEKTD
jgi:flagellum-specific peptidoglycan hydrolase FlgJ